MSIRIGRSLPLHFSVSFRRVKCEAAPPRSARQQIHPSELYLLSFLFLLSIFLPITFAIQLHNVSTSTPNSQAIRRLRQDRSHYG